jgi:hypothetical protein
MRSTRAAAALAGALLLAGCTGGEPDPAPEPTTATSTAPAPAPPTPPTPAAQAPGPTPAPEPTARVDAAAADAFVAAVGADLGRDSAEIKDVLISQGVFICQTLSVTAQAPDEAVEVYQQYLAEDPVTTGPLWDNAVEHLCPELVDGYELVLDRAQG